MDTEQLKDLFYMSGEAVFYTNNRYIIASENEPGETGYRLRAGFEMMPADWQQDFDTFEELVAEMETSAPLTEWAELEVE